MRSPLALVGLLERIRGQPKRLTGEVIQEARLGLHRRLHPMELGQIIIPTGGEVTADLLATPVGTAPAVVPAVPTIAFRPV